ncbi:MAG: O-antigen polymerase [Terracidiphilus sp.]
MLKEGQSTRVIRWRRLFAAIVVLVAVILLVRRERVEAPGAGVLAAILLVISAATLLRAAVKTGSFLNSYTLVLGTFLLTYPLSAFVHLTGSDYVSLGFYEIAALDTHTQLHHVYLSLALVFLAQLALWWGLAPARPESPRNGPQVVRVRSTLLVLAGALFTLVGIAGTTLLFSGSNELLADVATIDRAKQLDAGAARFVFMSTWLSWGIIFLLTAFLVSKTSKIHPRVALVVLVGASTCMFLNLFWTGSRAENLLAVLPLIFVVKKIAPRHFRSFASVIAVGVMGIILFETIARTTTLLNSGLEDLARSGMSTSQFVANQSAAIFDWQMGRYPTISLSFDMVHRYGHALGSTLLAGLAMTINAPATLLHIPLKVPEPQAMTALVGQYIYEDPSINGVVPGTLAELYFNFGAIGVFCGFFVIGRIAKYCISATHSALDIGTILLSFYILTLLCVWTIPMTATLGVYLLATRGVPILLFCAVEQTLSRSVSFAPRPAAQAALP